MPGLVRMESEHALWRLKSFDWRSQSPSHVLLLIGTNDIGYPACDICWESGRWCRSVHATFPKARVVVTSILPRGTDLMGADDKIRAVNAAPQGASAPAADFAFFDPAAAMRSRARRRLVRCSSPTSTCI